MAITTGDIGVSSIPEDATGKGLKVGALGMISSLVIGVASTAPAYSLAATLGFVAAYVGLQSPAVMLLAFVPMLFIAAAYYYLNRADPDCGTTFTWVTRAIGPKTGWMAGWGILVTDLVVMPNLASIAGVYTFSLFGAHGIAANSSGFWVTFVGVIWLVDHDGHLLHRHRIVGPDPGGSARRRDRHPLHLRHRGPGQGVHGPPGPQHPAVVRVAEPLQYPPIGALSAGMLLAVFIYWGWDTAVTVNEEAKDTRRTPGRAALWSTLVLLLIYVVVSAAAQAVHGVGFLTNTNNKATS